MESSIPFNLNNKARHSYIYVAYSRPNGWTDWAEIFLWILMGGRGGYRLNPKDINFKVTVSVILIDSQCTYGPIHLDLFICRFPRLKSV